MRGPVLALLAAIGTSAAYSILPLPARGAVSRSSGVRALEADASPAVVSVSDRSVECELCVPIADGAWHHLAATWDGTAQEPTLSLYVDGVLEMIEAGSRHPARSGYTVASRCTAGLCENGMQIGGFYQSGGGGFTGQFFHGLIDEVRVWSRPRTADEIRAAMGGNVRRVLMETLPAR